MRGNDANKGVCHQFPKQLCVKMYFGGMNVLIEVDVLGRLICKLNFSIAVTEEVVGAVSESLQMVSAQGKYFLENIK